LLQSAGKSSGDAKAGSSATTTGKENNAPTGKEADNLIRNQYGETGKKTSGS
jgi:hypothetical protein